MLEVRPWPRPRHLSGERRQPVLMVVPDGITRVTLGPFRVDPAMSSIATVTAAVHDNVATLVLRGFVASKLPDPSCCTTAPAATQMTWYVSNGGVRHIAFDLWLIVGAPRGRR